VDVEAGGPSTLHFRKKKSIYLAIIKNEPIIEKYIVLAIGSLNSVGLPQQINTVKSDTGYLNSKTTGVTPALI
jgi:hypothetical protein